MKTVKVLKMLKNSGIIDTYGILFYKIPKSLLYWIMYKKEEFDEQAKSYYEYYVGESIIDPYGYQIEFENNIAINTTLFEH